MKRIAPAAGAVFLLLLILFGCVSVSKEAERIAELRPEITRELATGWEQLWSDRFEEAEEHFRSALEMNPDEIEAHRGLGLALFARGRCFEAGEELITALEANPISPFAAPMRDFAAAQVPFHREIRKRLSEAEEMLADQETHPWIRRWGLTALQEYHLQVEPEPGTVRRYAEELGTVTDWRILGPFSNVSRSGFDESFIEETDTGSLDFERKYSGIGNREISWFTPELETNHGGVPLSDYLGHPEYFTAYAYAAVEIEDAGDYFLVFDRAGATKCWLDGELILTDAEPRYGAEIHWIKRSLDNGSHELLVKVASETRPAGFRLSISPVESDIYENRSSETYRKLLPQAETFGFDPLLASLAAQLDSEDRRQESEFWLAYMTMRKGHAYEGLELIQDLRSVGSGADGAYFDYLESLLYRSLDKPNDARNSLVRSYERSVLFAPAASYLLEEYSGQQRWDRVESLLEEAEESFGEWYTGRLYRVWLAASRDGVEAALEDMEGFFEDYPDVPQLELMLLDSDFGFKAHSAVHLVEEVREKGLSTLASMRLMRFYRDWGNHVGAHSLASGLKESLPTSEEIWHAYLMCGLYSGLWSPETASEKITELFASLPFAASLIRLEVMRAENTYYGLKRYQREQRSSTEVEKDIEEEKERYTTILEKYLSFFPDDYYARNELRELAGMPGLDQLFDVTDAAALIEQFESEDIQYGDDAVVVLSEDNLIFFGDGASRSYTKEIIKILSRTGVRDNSTYRLDFHPVYDEVEVTEAYVLKPDGSQTHPIRAADRLSFPGLDVGDYVVVRYSRNSCGCGPLNREIWGRHTLNGFYPVYRSEFRLVYPESCELTVKYHNTEGRHIVEEENSTEEGMRELHISSENMEPVRMEGWIPDWKDVLAWVDVSSIGSWSEVADWYRKLSRGQCIITPKIRSKVKELTVGKTDREEIISCIFDFVSREIEYEDLSFMYSAYVPQKAETVLEDGYGDCKDQSTLLVTMLAAAGIESCIALSTPDYGGENFYLPSPRFTHAVVVIPDERGDMVLDPTTSFYSYPELPPSMVGSYYLPVPASVAELPLDLRRIALHREPKETYYLVEVEASPEGGMVRGTAVFAGHHAGLVRSLLQSNSPAYRKQAFGWFLQERVAGFELETLGSENEDRLDSPPLIDFTGTVPRLLEPLDESLLSLEIPWFVNLPPGLRNIGVSEDRKTAVDIEYLDLASPARQVAVVHIPAGYTLHAVPEDADFSYGDVSVSYRYREKTGTLICERFLRIPVMSVAVEDLGPFNALKERIFAKERERVILKAAGL